MALDKLVDSSVLDAAMRYTANRIRAKTGGSENLPFDMSAENPKGFGDAVDSIQTGGTPTGTKQITITENGTTTENVSGYANAEITVNVNGGGDDPKALIRSRLNGTLTEYVDDQLTTVVDSAFNQCFNLTILRLHGLTKLTGNWLGNTAVTALAFPNVTSGWTGYSFNGAKKLKAVDFSKIPKVVSNGFLGTSVIDTLVLRNSTVVPLENINAFNSTKFKDGSTGGTLYVPSALISSYQSATNWSTILGYANNQILPIEGSIYETQYADGTPIT